MRKILSICMLVMLLMLTGCSAESGVADVVEDTLMSYVESIDVRDFVEEAGIDMSDEQINELNIKIRSTLSEKLPSILKDIKESEDLKKAIAELDNIVEEQISNYDFSGNPDK